MIISFPFVLCLQSEALLSLQIQGHRDQKFKVQVNNSTINYLKNNIV